MYRKYSNNKAYFKVLSPVAFEEVSVVGRSYCMATYESPILPHRNLIADMLACKGGHWQVIDAAQYDAFVRHCAQEYKLLV